MTSSKLGTDIDTQQIVELLQASRRQGLYIIGANGTGKTGLIEHLILQDIDQGLGVGLLDPHGDLVNAILAKMTKREDDVILLDIQDEDHPFGVNIFECPNPQSPTAVQKIVDLVMHIFEKLYDVSRQTPRMAQFLRNCTHTLVANPGYTMADIPLLLQDEECRKKLVANVTDPQVQLFWKTYNALRPSEQFDRAESTINKMDELLQPLPRNIVGQGKTTVNIQQVMDERKILLVKLSAQLDQVTSLVGTLFIALFLNAAYSRASLPVNKRKQFNLYADEFQRFATEDFATLLTEARKFGIATTIAHQARYQPGMTDGIRAVSLQAANHVVFRVTSPDADELAGGFDITPQAAWEEEIEKEWVEVLKSEWYERREEEVIDGEEEIKTPVKDVVHHLLNGGSHTNPVINQFRYETLTVINSYGADNWWKQVSEGVNSFLYKAMTGLPLTKDDLFPVVCSMCHIHKLTAFSYTLDHDNVKGSVALYEYWITGNDSSLYPLYYEHVRKMGLEQIRTELMQIDRCMHDIALNSSSTYVLGATPLPPVEALLPFLKQFYEANRPITSLNTPRFGEPPTLDWFCIDVAQLEWKQVSFETSYGQHTKWEIQPHQEWKFFHESDLSAIINKIYQEDLPHFINLVIQLKEVMQALAAQPIEVGSGLVRPRKRKQINILTHPAQTIVHPRKVIMHPQRTFQDVQKDIANQLSGFPNFTALVKLNEIAAQNPGKKCLSCKSLNNPGAKFCSKCGKKLPAPNEYTLSTLKPLGGLGKAALQQRLTTIQANNQQKGYVRDRSKVEAEILNRQTQQPTPQAHHARQVPVQGKCPNCGAVNSPKAKFCNQCGTQL